MEPNMVAYFLAHDLTSCLLSKVKTAQTPHRPHIQYQLSRFIPLSISIDQLIAHSTITPGVLEQKVLSIDFDISPFSHYNVYYIRKI